MNSLETYGLIHDCIENAISYPVTSVLSAGVTVYDTIAGNVLIGNREYNYEIDKTSVSYARSDGSEYDDDSAHLDAAKCKRGIPCGDRCIPRGQKCRKGMSPSAQQGGSKAKRNLKIAAGVAAGALALRHGIRGLNESIVTQGINEGTEHKYIDRKGARKLIDAYKKRDMDYVNQETDRILTRKLENYEKQFVSDRKKAR